jgi:hypothetical protein
MVPVGAIPESLMGSGFERILLLIILSSIGILALGEIIFAAPRK